MKSTAVYLESFANSNHPEQKKLILENFIKPNLITENEIETQPNEKEEVRLARQILTALQTLRETLVNDKVARLIDVNSIPSKYGSPLLDIQSCAQRIIQMHEGESKI